MYQASCGNRRLSRSKSSSACNDSSDRDNDIDCDISNTNGNKFATPLAATMERMQAICSKHGVKCHTTSHLYHICHAAEPIIVIRLGNKAHRPP